MRVPADTFQLFLATGVLNSRFGTLAAAMHMIVLALAGTYALSGQLRLSGPRVLRYALVTAAATAGGVRCFVVERPRGLPTAFEQAENRLHTIKALLVATLGE